MLVTIGILGRNEADKIGQTIQSLLSQSAFTPDGSSDDTPYRWQIVVVANGCTDDTAERARDVLLKASSDSGVRKFSFEVVSLERPGKSNAWNEFIHKIAPVETDVFVLMDADIEFGHPDTVANSIKTLLSDPSALVVVGRPLKHFTRKAKPSVLERISIQASKTSDQDPPGIAGSFYCARSATLRNVWMPIGLSVEDGFLAAMITTDGFRGEPDPSRIVRATDATHYFEGLSSIHQIIMHEVRLVIGTLFNCYLCWDALLFLTPASGSGAGATIRELNQSKPDWYARMMSNEIKARGFWVIPAAVVFRRWASWARLPLTKKVSRLPLTIAAFAFDLIVMNIANWRMVTGRAVGFW